MERQQNAKWGDGFLKQLSEDLNAEFPEMNGWSERNLRRIRQWYMLYSQHIPFRTQPVSEIDANTAQAVPQLENTKRQQPVDIIENINTKQVVSHMESEDAIWLVSQNRQQCVGNL